MLMGVDPAGDPANATQVCKVPKTGRIFIFTLFAFVTLVSLALFLGVITTPDSQVIARWTLSAWLGLLVWIWYNFLRMPVEIRWADEGSLVVCGVIGSTKIAVRDITSIHKVGLPGQRQIRLRHTRGTILLYWMTGFNELLNRVEGLNPAVEIKGF
jgi:hypothetical protein